MRRIEWHEVKVDQVLVMIRDNEVVGGLDFNGDGRSLSPLYTVTHVARADQASNESGVIAVTIGDDYQIDQSYIDSLKQYGKYEFYACDQSEVGQDVREMIAILKGQVEEPKSSGEPFISTTTTKTEKVVSGETPVIGEISCSPGITIALGNDLNDRIVHRIALSEDRTIIELFDPDDDIIVTIRPLEYTAFYLKPNKEEQA